MDLLPSHPGRKTVLPWDCRVPLLRWTHPRPLPPRFRLLSSSGSDRSMPTSVLVPSLWDLTTSTVCSAYELRACCIPVPDLGFAGFQWSPSSPSEEGSDRVLVPTSAVPFEGLLLVGSRTPSLGSAPFLTVRIRSDGNRRPTDEPALTNGVTPCVSRSDGACATGGGWAFPPLRHHAQVPITRYLRCWSLCEL
jgi:hypothetical protein